jgi:tetratricopeptide (TPR) repeat protein
VVAGGLVAGYVLLRLLLSATSFSPALVSFAAFGGAIGLVAIAIFIMLVARLGWRWLWMSWLLLTMVVGLWLGVFNLPDDVTQNYSNTPVVGDVLATMDEWRELPTVGRFGRMLEAESGTGKVRVLIWEGALELIQPHEPLVYPDGEVDRFNFLRPLIGYGPESMYVAYNRFYVPELATVEARNASPDRSHNETFDALIITGALGFLIWQALYLSVFYYGFQWLGVVRTTRDRNILIALWIGGAIAGALLITQWLGNVYLGVAIPFGSIGGLVLYLIYYALFASTGRAAEEAPDDPFQVDRLLMMGLLAAVVAHYVEIHFGIAIAATRVHFFLYVALMFLVGYLLPRYREEAQEEAATAGRARTRGRRWRRRFSGSQPAWVSSVLAATFVMSVILATLSYDFMNFVLPPGRQVQTLADVPSTGEIVHQAFFINPQQNFADSPFIFLVIALTWVLGSLASISELARQDILKISAATNARLRSEQVRNAIILFAVLIVAGFAIRFLNPPQASVGTSRLLGQGLLLIWSAACLFALIRLMQGVASAPRTAAFIAAAGVAFSLPVLAAGVSLYGIIMLAASAAILYILWDDVWNGSIVPALFISVVSFLIGIAFAYLQASQIRSAVFFGPPQAMGELERLIFSADRFTGFLTLFYVFIVTMMLLGAFALARSRISRSRSSGTTAGIASLVVLLGLGIYVVSTTNLSIIQGDIVYKQAGPLDRQATQAGTPEAWDAPIAIYEHAIELAPLEDFYYLFLGRAYLEKSGVTQDPEQQRQLLETARERLLVAQEINPLNTDHTANLARLTTRWASLGNLDPQQRETMVAQAKDFYQDALSLSPQNSVIRNEYANLLATLDGDCDAAIATFERSLEIDPFYANTYYSLAGVYELCAEGLGEEQQEAYYEEAAELLQQGLERNDDNAGSILVQAGQLYQRAGEYDSAVAVLQQAQEVPDSQVPDWNVNFRLASVYQEMGDEERAQELATSALEDAPPDAQEQIQAFLDGLSN